VQDLGLVSHADIARGRGLRAAARRLAGHSGAGTFPARVGEVQGS
jgi:hypothetical protein